MSNIKQILWTDYITDSREDINNNFSTLNNNKADKFNVLEKDNNTPYEPTNDYNPSTKKYVDENKWALWGNITWTLSNQTDLQDVLDNKVSWTQSITTILWNDDSTIPTSKAVADAIGNWWGWDMLKSTYDTDNNWVVDNAEKLNWQDWSYYLDRSNHTGTQAMSDITDLQDTLDSKQDILYEWPFVNGDKTKLDNQSWVNTGDQDLTPYEKKENKSNDTNLGTSDELYPTQRAVKIYADNHIWSWDMMKSDYDTNNNWIVDNSERLNWQVWVYYIHRENHIWKNTNTIDFEKRTYSSSSWTTTIDWTQWNKTETILTENTTLSFTNPNNSCNLLLVVKQNSNWWYSITFPSNIKWSWWTAPTITTDANAIDIVSFYYDWTDYYWMVANDFK